MGPNVASVRQNLSMLVDGAQNLAAGDPNDTHRWGATLGGRVYVWRSGVGVDARGNLIYVGGPALNIGTLADVLIRAGAVRAMELDINTAWVSYFTYTGGGACRPDPGNAAARRTWTDRRIATSPATPATSSHSSRASGTAGASTPSVGSGSGRARPSGMEVPRGLGDDRSLRPRPSARLPDEPARATGSRRSTRAVRARARCTFGGAAIRLDRRLRHFRSRGSGCHG